MPLIETPWTITWGAVTILGVGDLLGAEIKGPSIIPQYQSVKPARGPVGVEISRGLIRGQLSFHRVIEFTTAEGAKDFLLQHMQDFAGVAGVLGYAPQAVLTKLQGGQWFLGNCKATASPTVRAQLFQCDYQLDYGLLSVIAAPPDPAPPAVEIDHVTETGDTMVTDTGATQVVNP